MDLNAIMVAIVGVLLFFGGTAWVEIHSRKRTLLARSARARHAESQDA